MITEAVARSMVEQAGGAYVGIQKACPVDLILFNDPETETTIAVRANIASVSMVKAKLLRSRMAFTEYKIAKPLVSPELSLEVRGIQDQARGLVGIVCTQTNGMEKIMSVLARLEALAQYLETR